MGKNIITSIDMAKKMLFLIAICFINSGICGQVYENIRDEDKLIMPDYIPIQYYKVYLPELNITNNETISEIIRDLENRHPNIDSNRLYVIINQNNLNIVCNIFLEDNLFNKSDYDGFIKTDSIVYFIKNNSKMDLPVTKDIDLKEFTLKKYKLKENGILENSLKKDSSVTDIWRYEYIIFPDGSNEYQGKHKEKFL